MGLGLFSLGIALEFLSARGELLYAGSVAAITSLIEIIRFNHAPFNAWFLNLGSRLAHAGEEKHVTSATWFWLAMFPVALLGSELVFALTLGVLSVGDQAAGIVGRKFGNGRLTKGRSLHGTGAFIVSSTVLCLAILYFYFPEVSTQQTVLLSITAAFAGGLSEVACSKLDDNFGVGIGTGLSVWAMTLWLGPF